MSQTTVFADSLIAGFDYREDFISITFRTMSDIGRRKVEAQRIS